MSFPLQPTSCEVSVILVLNVCSETDGFNSGSQPILENLETLENICLLSELCLCLFTSQQLFFFFFFFVISSALTHTHTQTGVEATSQPPALTADSVLSLQGVFTAGQEDSEDQQERSPRCPNESSRETEVETDVKEKEEFEKMNNELRDVLQEEDVGEIDAGERSEDVRQDWGESQRGEENSSTS